MPAGRTESDRRVKLGGHAHDAHDAYVARRRKELAKYEAPLEELRDMLDKCMGRKTLTGELYRLRQEQ